MFWSAALPAHMRALCRIAPYLTTSPILVGQASSSLSIDKQHVRESVVFVSSRLANRFPPRRRRKIPRGHSQAAFSHPVVAAVFGAAGIRTPAVRRPRLLPSLTSHSARDAANAMHVNSNSSSWAFLTPARSASPCELSSASCVFASSRFLFTNLSEDRK